MEIQKIDFNGEVIGIVISGNREISLTDILEEALEKYPHDDGEFYKSYDEFCDFLENYDDVEVVSYDCMDEFLID